MNRAEVSALPDRAAGQEFVYAVARCDGVVKIGCTADPKTRIATLFDLFRRSGHSMTGAYVVSCVHRWSTERLIRRMLAERGARPIANSKEWFQHIDPSDVADVVRDAAMKYA